MNMRRDVIPLLLMPALAPRAIVGALLLSISSGVLAGPEPLPAVAEDQRLLPYIQPGQLVDIGGRHINLHCAGAGKPTVILLAGIFSWSVVWYKTQPVIAQKTRVCAFDRAAYGFSDPAPRPQILSGTVCTSGTLFGRHRGSALYATLAQGGRGHGPRRLEPSW